MIRDKPILFVVRCGLIGFVLFAIFTILAYITESAKLLLIAQISLYVTMAPAVVFFVLALTGALIEAITRAYSGNVRHPLTKRSQKGNKKE